MLSRSPWASSIKDLALDLALRCETQEQFIEQWMQLGNVVRFLATQEQVEQHKPDIDWGDWEWWRSA